MAWFCSLFLPFRPFTIRFIILSLQLAFAWNSFGNYCFDFSKESYTPPLNSRFLKSQFTGFLLIRGDLFGMFLFIRDSFSLVVLDFCGFLKFGLFQTFWIFQDPFRITELARITLDGRIILWLCLDLYGFLQSPSRFIEILSNLRWVLSVEFWRRWHKLLLTKNIRCC